MTRSIEAAAWSKPSDPAPPGPAPMLQWVAITDLIIDDTYQRPIYGAGKRNVRRIAENFRWSRFAPIVVAPVEGGKFAIIDGQHRVTAAAVRGIEQVPAQVVIADTREQADAFRAINGETTRVSALNVQRAAAAAGDPDAVELASVAAAAGVTILGYPKAADSIAPGETMAVGALRAALKEHGRDTLITALMCVTETTNNIPGALSATTIKAICAVLAWRAEWRDAGARLLAAFDEIDLETEAAEARTQRRPKGVSNGTVLADRLTERLTVLLRSEAA